MKNNKKAKAVFAIVLVVAIAAVVAVFVAKGFEKDQQTTTAPATEKTTVIIKNTKPTVKVDDVDTTVAKTSTTQKSDDIQKIKGTYWYLFDNDKCTCYVFNFSKDSSNVDLAYFPEETINGMDPEYSKGYSIYKENANQIVIENMPDAFPIKNFTLTVKDGKVFCGDTQLEQNDQLNLNNALRHFV